MYEATIRLSDGRRMPLVGCGLGGIKPEATTGLVKSAIAAGYRLIDTASIYGNESQVGQAVSETDLPRSSLFIVTKCWPDQFAAETVQHAFDESLARLGLDYVDLYLLHWPAPELDLYVDAWNELIRLRKEGRVKSIGVSNFFPGQIERISGETGVTPAVNQIQLHPYYQRIADRNFHLNNAIATQCWSPLCRGACLDDETIVSIARKHGVTGAQIVLRFLVDQNLAVVPRSASPERLIENIDISSIALDPEDRQQLTALDKGIAGMIGTDPTFAP